MRTIRSLAITASFSLAFIPSLAQAQCTMLTKDLNPGMTDANLGSQIIALQRYLSVSGYLAATPNGTYGPATTAAVKSFQAANGISATGNVGQLTRIALQLKSCAAPTIPAQTAPTQPAAPATESIPSIIVTSPKTGNELSFGKTTTIRWNGDNNSTYSIKLEDEKGVTRGFIASSVTGNEYAWKIGVVDANDADVFVSPGNYRVRIEKLNGSVTSVGQSGIFKIASAAMYIDTIYPRTVRADNSTAVIVYGSGYFADKATVKISGYSDIAPLYVSPDGRALIFNIPSGVYPGSHQISISNNYGSGVSAESNQKPITVLP
jgi:peptidoglycan hydrolase-like protein with peptidoglycan-binding domain